MKLYLNKKEVEIVGFCACGIDSFIESAIFVDSEEELTEDEILELEEAYPEVIFQKNYDAMISKIDFED